MIRLVIDCQGCDNTLSESDTSKPAGLEFRALRAGWKKRGAHGHLCPECVRAEEADTILAASAADYEVRD